jgi:hypothetical protein
METHLKVVAVLHMAFGAIGLVTAAILMLLVGGAAGIVGASGEPDAVAAVPIIGIAGTFVVMVVGVLSLPSLVVGVGLWKRMGWARVGGIVLSILLLFGFPFATILGVYGLWVLFSKDTERLFYSGAPTVVIEQPR